MGQIRHHITLNPNTEISLIDLVHGEKASDNQRQTFYLGRLVLEAQSKLILDRDITIDAQEVILNPKSVIETHGHHLILKTQKLKAVWFDPDQINLSEHDRKQSMGAIDLRAHTLVRDGDPGQNAKLPGKAGKDMVVTNPNGRNTVFGFRFELAQPGMDGVSGTAGLAGKDSGDFILYVPEYTGLYVLARGGSGGKGGDGSKGGAGGNGSEQGITLYYENEDGNGKGVDAFVIYPPNTGKTMQDGENGGRGGDAGSGGPGGKGGKIQIVYSKKDVSKENITAFYEIEGGQGGNPGKPGLGGDPGRGGSISEAIQFGSSWRQSYGNQGQPGRLGQRGLPGDNGRDGKVRIVSGNINNNDDTNP